MDTKLCKICNISKPISEFRYIRKNKNGTELYKAQCHSCVNAKSLERWRNMDEDSRYLRGHKARNKKTFEERKNYRLKYRFGISIDDFNNMLVLQNNACYICNESIKGKEIKVDHCHKTGKLRKLLCHNCNSALGLLHDNAEIFETCARYIREHD